MAHFKKHPTLPRWANKEDGILVYKPCDKKLFRIVTLAENGASTKNEILGKRFKTYKAAIAAATKYIETKGQN